MEQEDGTWWALKDVCSVLEISKYRDAGRLLDEDERVSIKTDTLGGAQEMTYISEAGLYKAIFRSNKSEANTFKRWVTHGVLPAIRKTGSYGTAPQFDAQAVAQIAAAVCAEVTKQLLVVLKPQTAPEQPTDIHELFEEELFFRSSCKLERAPAYIREPVDEMFRRMMELQRLNFSAIVRFCHKNNFKISNPAVRRYYNRVICAADDAAS